LVRGEKISLLLFFFPLPLSSHSVNGYFSFHSFVIFLSNHLVIIHLVLELLELLELLVLIVLLFLPVLVLLVLLPVVVLFFLFLFLLGFRSRVSDEYSYRRV
jgi:hypothetical protein